MIFFSLLRASSSFLLFSSMFSSPSASVDGLLFTIRLKELYWVVTSSFKRELFAVFSFSNIFFCDFLFFVLFL